MCDVTREIERTPKLQRLLLACVTLAEECRRNVQEAREVARDYLPKEEGDDEPRLRLHA